jgi:hypothetical protein
MAKYEVWARSDKARKRISRGFVTERDAREAMADLQAKGFRDLVIVQTPPRYGSIKGLTRKGRT